MKIVNLDISSPRRYDSKRAVMIIKSKSHIPALISKKARQIPVIPVKSAILFPGEAVTLQLTRPQNIRLVEENYSKGKIIGVSFSPRGEVGQRRIDLCQIGTAARIVSKREGPGKSMLVVLEGTERIYIHGLSRKNPYVIGRVSLIKEKQGLDAETEKYSEEIIYLIGQITKINPAYADSLLAFVRYNMENPGRLADRIAAAFHFPVKVKQEILESIEIQTRLKKIRRFLKSELQQSVIDDNSFTGSRQSPADGLTIAHQWQKAVEKYRSENGNEKLINELREKVNESDDLPDEVYEKCLSEIDRLSNLSTASAEYGATRHYLDWLLNIPWNKSNGDSYDLKEVEKIISREYYGSSSIKKQILERVAIRKLSGRADEASVLCLAGAPGTGKASLAKAIAHAMGKEFIRISVGGMDEIAEIKGSSRTYPGAMPGIIIRTLRKVQTSDPVVYIENIEYLDDESAVALSMALLEAIDPRLNGLFLDKYIGIPVDLSRVLFICSARSDEEIPETISPRLEVIEIPGYIEKEKIGIARKHIIPKTLKKHGLLRKDIKFTEKGMRKIIRNYTMEAGLLDFKRRIERICRQIAKEKAGRSKKVWTITEKNVEKFLGTPQYIIEKPGKSPEIGVVIGLAWTGTGGDLMIIEGLKMKGSGDVITTGSLGEVMKESIQAAHSYVRAKADVLGIDHSDFSNFDIHIHFPSGAIPKDGPSAGVAVSLVIASVMAERPIRNDIAMTGEVTLRGKVLQVGGLSEKISAAYRAGIRTVLVPSANQKDLKNLSADIVKKTKFVFIESIDEVFSQGLLDFVPSSFTLEKIFAEEMEKAKRRKDEKAEDKIAAKGRKKK